MENCADTVLKKLMRIGQNRKPDMFIQITGAVFRLL